MEIRRICQPYRADSSIDSFPLTHVLFIMYEAPIGLARVTDRASQYP